MRGDSVVRQVLLALMVASLGGCGGGSSIPSSPSSPSPIPQPALSTLVGTVVDRVGEAREPVDGSTITLASPDGRSYSADVRAGQFLIPSVVNAIYDVKIVGPTHVTYEQRGMIISSDQRAEFGVLKWNASRFGIVYNEPFHEFFHRVARESRSVSPPGYNTNTVAKWDVANGKPSEIYVATETLLGLPVSPAVVSRTVDFVNNSATAISRMFCGRVSRLPVRTGPTLYDCRQTPCVVTVPQGMIHISFDDAEGNNAAAADWWTDGVIKTGHINLTPSNVNETALRHELFHVAFANHCFTSPADKTCPDFPGSLMSYGFQNPELSPADRLVACLVYDDRTTPNNRYPDINFFVK